jgi:hypothetical protein
MIKIGELSGINNVEVFLGKLAKKFTLSSDTLNTISKLIIPTHYSYFVDLKLREEASYESCAYHALKINSFSDIQVIGKFYYRWTTSSDHEVVIESSSDRMFFYEEDWQDHHCETYKAIFNVLIGEDSSSCFYPTVKNIFEDMQKG